MRGITYLLVSCFMASQNLAQQNFGFPPLRSEPQNEMIVPISTRFLMRGAPVENTAARPTSIITFSPYQVLHKTSSLPDEEETWHEGPLDTEGKLAARLTWKAFESDINQRIESEMMWVPLKVLSGNGQVVSGVLYDLKVLAGTSNCSRYEVNAYTIQENNCVHFNGPKRAIFSIMVTERSSSWKPFIPDWDRIFSTFEREVADNEDL